MTDSWNIDEIKAAIAKAGGTVKPDATSKLLPRPDPGTHGVIILDRVADVHGEPPYCVHGYASCISCEQMCYLGSETHAVVADPGNDIYPICMPCAKQRIPGSAPLRKRFLDHPNPNYTHDH